MGLAASGCRGRNVVIVSPPIITLVYDPEGIAVTQASQAGGLGAKTGLYKVVDQRGRGASNKQTLEPRKDTNTNSLTSVQKDNLITDRMSIRRLTPKECERLQAFPDDWTQYGVDSESRLVPVSDTQRYKMCGNAVTTNVIQAVFERIYSSVVFAYYFLLPY